MAASTEWKNRIVRHEMADPKELMPYLNRLNFRTHPLGQQSALEGALEEVGWVGSVMRNERTGNIIDGHLRIPLAVEKGQTQIPVDYVDLSEEEEALVLASYDPIAALAGADAEKLEALLHQVNTGNAGLQQMLSDLAQDNGVLDSLSEAEAPEDFPEYDEDIKTDYCCPSCHYEWSGKPK